MGKTYRNERKDPNSPKRHTELRKAKRNSVKAELHALLKHR